MYITIMCYHGGHYHVMLPWHVQESGSSSGQGYSGVQQPALSWRCCDVMRRLHKMRHQRHLTMKHTTHMTSPGRRSQTMQCSLPPRSSASPQWPACPASAMLIHQPAVKTFPLLQVWVSNTPPLPCDTTHSTLPLGSTRYLPSLSQLRQA